MSFEKIEVKTIGKLGYITIDRPEVRNALNRETLEEIVKGLDLLSKNEEVGCIIFTGKGEKSFAAGADIKQLRERTAIDALNPFSMQGVYDIIENCEKPTIAMVNGYALGGGCELAMACDIRIASTNAKFGLPELNLSIIPSAGGTQRLARLVGKGKALEMILTGKMISAEEALQFGLVSDVVEFDELNRTVDQLASQILNKGPLAVKLAKIAVNYGTEADIKTGLVLEKLSQAVLFSSEDKNEGTQAFIEKRKPNFQGK
ncbi:enoyl-CoA hydratase/isomerase family protein [Oceanobacillus halophilus]|uniref:Enoyl-CoA hydratase/isomerase family protein n=1 Tax=Oceanobacillus halophilus TaxID=930130 RepID=A0A495A7H6_9BACI|nr:enoyl-CoA hydratase-related protein [Oceanobacillus halophilus]RKQ35750.1 enoyl-CoA hydratase/isomerase family protein [Oceanobacillus halophilus]